MNYLGRHKLGGGFAHRCQSCGHTFASPAAARRAILSGKGCPSCGSSAIYESRPLKDGVPPLPQQPSQAELRKRAAAHRLTLVTADAETEDTDANDPWTDGGGEG